MEIFYYITQHMMNFNNLSLLFNNNKNLIVEVKTNPFLFYNTYYHSINTKDEQSYLILNLLYTLIYNKKTKHYNKFIELNKILNNIFMSNELKDKYFSIFTKIQKIKFYLKKFGFICKYKKMKIQVGYDLLLNSINIQDINTICIIQDNFKYLFTIRDLVNIIETALSNAPGFFVNILTPKNPFNNIDFSLSCLYNIYFKLKESQYVMPILFHLYFLSNFDKRYFVLEYEAIIRDYAIKKFVYNTPAALLRKEVMEMLENNIYTKRFKIDKNFPNEQLGSIMKPFLYYYYIVKYSVCGTEKIYLYKHILFDKLRIFYYYNPNFGRKYYNIIGKTKILSFNSKHLLFKNIDLNERYIANHDIYDEIYDNSSQSSSSINSFRSRSSSSSSSSSR